MKMQQQSIYSVLDQDVLWAWREGVAQAAQNTSVKQQIIQRERELLPCFAAHYQRLMALPRRVRRSLQRK
jgi:hypothetical protein